MIGKHLADRLVGGWSTGGSIRRGSAQKDYLRSTWQTILFIGSRALGVPVRPMLVFEISLRIRSTDSQRGYSRNRYQSLDSMKSLARPCTLAGCCAHHRAASGGMAQACVRMQLVWLETRNSASGPTTAPKMPRNSIEILRNRISWRRLLHDLWLSTLASLIMSDQKTRLAPVLSSKDSSGCENRLDIVDFLVSHDPLRRCHLGDEVISTACHQTNR